MKVIDEPRLYTRLAVITAKHRYLSGIAGQFIEALTKAEAYSFTAKPSK